MSGENASSSREERDRLLMAALSKGDDRALSEIMSRWQRPVTAYLYRTVGDYEMALDLAQEVFVRVYRNRTSYKSKGNFSSWLFTIATNLAKNHFRWKKRHPEAPLEEAVLPERGSEKNLPSKILEQSEESARVRKAVLELPEKLRVPLVLFYYQELPQSEIARILGCSEKTVETRIYRARNRLRELL